MGRGPFIFAAIFATIGLGMVHSPSTRQPVSTFLSDISITTAVLFPYPLYSVRK